MKKSLVTIMFIVIALLLSVTTIYGNSTDDFKVIKKSIKKTSGEVKYLKITIFNKQKRKNTVNLKFPLEIIELISECTKDSIDINMKNHCKFDLKKILRVLKKNGPTTLVEVDEEDELIKIWFE
jgi:hypothetical protein